jgi:hypothetical protein
MKTFFSLLVLVVLVVLLWFGWQRYHRTQVLDSGVVHCDGCLTGEREAAFLRENSGEGPDGQSEHKWDFSRGADGQKREYSDADDPNYKAPYSPDQQTAPAETRAAGDPYDRVYTGGPRPGGYAPGPGRDTLALNPPNGERFGGRGTFQWYRQGNLTWREDTVSGQSCIAYATPEEWRKRNVLAHGCGSF